MAVSIAAWCFAFALCLVGTDGLSQPKRPLLRGAALDGSFNVSVLPSVSCIRVISLSDSDVGDLFTTEVLEPYGLASRTIIQTEQRDAMGGNVGCFRAHVRAWNAALAMHCERLLVFEDDAYFENDVADAGLARAEAFLKSHQHFDLLFLGFEIPEVGRGPDRANGCRVGSSVAACVHQLHGWTGTHAYIISAEAMQRWRHWEPRLLPANGTYERMSLELAIDTKMSRDDRDGFFTIRPMIAFQRLHNSSIQWGANHSRQQTLELLRSTSAWVHARESRMLYRDMEEAQGCGLQPSS